MMADSNKKAREHEREITLAEEDFRHDEEEFDSVAGEEDPGAALEELVEYDKSRPEKKK